MHRDSPGGQQLKQNGEGHFSCNAISREHPQSCQIAENKNETVRHLLSNKAATFFCFNTSQFARLFAREPRRLRWRRMEDSVQKLQAEFVDLLRKQVEALELDAYVGLTDEERSEYYERQERIRDLDAKMSGSSDRVA